MDAVHLTFDDGPHPEITPWVLDRLDKLDAKATFFFVGRNAEQFPELVTETRRRGHTVGNHTYFHLNGWNTSCEQYLDDVERCNTLLKSTLFRPPFGRITPGQVKALRKRYRIIMWDVMPGDYKQHRSPETILNRIMSRARPGSIIVLHENEKAWTNLKAVLPNLEWLKIRGMAPSVVESAHGFNTEPYFSMQSKPQ